MNNNHKLLIRALANTANNSHIQYINTELMMLPSQQLTRLAPRCIVYNGNDLPMDNSTK